MERFVVVPLFNCVQIFATPWSAACQAWQDKNAQIFCALRKNVQCETEGCMAGNKHLCLTREQWKATDNL